MPQSQPLRLGALVPKFMTLKLGKMAQVSLETRIEPHDLVHCLRLVCYRQKAKVLLLDYCCLLLKPSLSLKLSLKRVMVRASKF